MLKHGCSYLLSIFTVPTCTSGGLCLLPGQRWGTTRMMKPTTRRRTTMHKSQHTGKARRTGSVQQTFCPIVEVEHEAMTLKRAGSQEWLAVLEVEGLNAHLRSAEEQYQLNEQFQHLLVALPHPLQILIRVGPIDLERYLSSFTLTPSQEAR